MEKIKQEWDKLPYNHAGRWEKNIKSIFNPNAKISFPQFIAEMVLYNKESYLKSYQKIPRGEGWSNSLQAEVRNLVQQAYTLCNYFPFINDEPLVVVAFKNFFRNRRVMNIGGYRKNRVTKTGKLNITQGEKDCVSGVSAELERLIKQRGVFKEVKSIETKEIGHIKFGNKLPTNKKTKIGALINLEKNLKHTPPENDITT